MQLVREARCKDRGYGALMMATKLFVGRAQSPRIILYYGTHPTYSTHAVEVLCSERSTND